MSPHEGQLFAPIISPPLRDNLGRAGTHQMDPGFASSKLSNIILALVIPIHYSQQ